MVTIETIRAPALFYATARRLKVAEISKKVRCVPKDFL
jgi:hypothetical protein